MPLRDILMIIQCGCLFGLFLEIWIIITRCKTKLHLYLLLSCIMCFINNIGYLFLIRAKSEEAGFIALKFSYLGRVWYSFFMLLFVTELVRFTLPFVVKAFLVMMSTGTYVVILQIGENELYYKNARFVVGNTFSAIIHENGPWHQMFMGIQVLYILFGLSILFIAFSKEKNKIAVRRLSVVMGSILALTIFFIVQLIGIPDVTNYYDVTIIGYFFCTIILLIAILSCDLLGMSEIARDYVIDRLSEGIIAVDNDGLVQYYNEPARRLYPELKRHSIAVNRQIVRTIDDAVRDDNVLPIEDRLYSPEENDLIHDGEKIGKLYVLADDTEHFIYMEELERQKAAADSANVAKSRFLANMSHEIRTPINAVLGMDEMILRESSDSTIRSYASDIMSAGKTLLSLINDILDLSKVEEGKMQIIPVQYELSSIINDLSNMIQQRAVNKGLKFDINVDEHIPHLLIGDEIRIRQCAMNLLTNAVKYTEKGSVTLDVTYEKTGDSEIMLGFAVSDTGIGMKQESIDKLFSPYERIEEKRNRAIEGTGLGMSITRQLLELMDSSLEVESEYGKGSVLSFAIKQQVVSWTEIGDISRRTAENRSKGDMYHELFHAPDARILIVDDTEINLTVMKSLLKKTGIRIDTAESGQDAITLAANNDYDVIFIDHMMPDMDGIETLEHIREIERQKDTPVIALTANAVSGAREMYIKAGFTDYISKPVDGEKLEKKLLHMLPEDRIIKTDDEADVSHQGGMDTKPKILAVDDDESVCRLIRSILEPLYDISISHTGADAVKMAKRDGYDLIMLDIHLPDSNGFAVMSELKANEMTADIPVLLVTGDNDAAVEEEGFRRGASDYIRKPFVPDILKQRAKRIIDLHNYQQSIEEEVDHQTKKSRRLSHEMMMVLSKTVDIKDHYTDGHSRRVAAMCAEIGRRLGKSSREQVLLYEIGLLHDIGKVGIHEDIIHKNSKLSDDEYYEIKSHTEKGYEILKEIADMPKLCEGARWHHEHYDGKGYPDGLKGEEIPEHARIACVADCYDAMTSTRTYSVPRKQEDVRAEIERCKGTWFDPVVADVMLKMIDEDTEYRMNEKAEAGDVWKEYDRLWGNAPAGIEAKDSEAASAAQAEEQLPLWLTSVEDINTKEGLKNCGSVEGYLSVLSVFNGTAAAKADEIEELYNKKDIPGYTIKVHALKSSARIIGAAELSELARTLEDAGKSNDTGYIEQNTDRLLHMYRDLGDKLTGDEAEDAKEMIDPAAMKEAYQTIYEIAGSMDYGLMDGILSDLKNYAMMDKDKENIHNIEKHLTELDWEAIAALAKTALDDIGPKQG